MNKGEIKLTFTDDGNITATVFISNLTSESIATEYLQGYGRTVDEAIRNLWKEVNIFEEKHG